MRIISIQESTHERLLRIVGELERRSQKQVALDTVIRFLIDRYTEKYGRQEAWKKFTEPIEGVDFHSVYDELALQKHSEKDFKE